MTHKLNGCSTHLISDYDLLNHWRVTHTLPGGVHTNLVSGSDLLKHWSDSQPVSGCQWIIRKSCQWSDLLNYLRVTHTLMGFSQSRKWF